MHSMRAFILYKIIMVGLAAIVKPAESIPLSDGGGDIEAITVYPWYSSRASTVSIGVA